MLINLEKQKLTIGQLKSGKIIENILTDHEISALNLINLWFSKTDHFSVATSGSTGQPKLVALSKALIAYSATTSLQFLDPESTFKSSLLCLNPSHIGGLMVVIRSLVAHLDLTIIPPSSNLNELPQDNFDLVSMVPLQLKTLINESPSKLHRFNTILLGGGPLEHEYEVALRRYKHLKVYHTYGMTETASHVALKNLSQGATVYKTLGDVQIALDKRSCLKLKGTITGRKWLQTNDVVEIIDANSFEWLGRSDFVINTGGIKVHPEVVEAQLAQQIHLPFFIAGLPDDKFGEKVVLIIESLEYLSVDLSALSKYEKPKQVLLLPKFHYTDSGKIDRMKSLQSLKT